MIEPIKKLLIIGFFLSLVCVQLMIVSAIDFTPQGDIELRGFYKVKNATNISAEYYCDIGEQNCYDIVTLAAGGAGGGNLTSVSGSCIYTSGSVIYLNNSCLIDANVDAGFNSTYNATYDAKADYSFSSNNFNGAGNFTTSGLINGANSTALSSLQSNFASWITNTVSNLVNYFTKTEVNSAITGNRTASETTLRADLQGNITQTESDLRTDIDGNATAIRNEITGNVSALRIYSAVETDFGIANADNNSDVLVIAGAGIAATTASGDTITITATEVDGSITNEIQNIWSVFQAQQGSTAASNDSDLLQIIGVGGINTTISGDILYINGTGVSGSGGSADGNASSICADGEYLDGSGSCINFNQTVELLDTFNNYSNSTGLGLSSFAFSINLGYRLPQNCNDGEIAEYNMTSGGWDCAIDNSAASGMSNWVLAATGSAGSEQITDGETVTFDDDNLYLNATRSTNTITYSIIESVLNNTILSLIATNPEGFLITDQNDQLNTTGAPTFSNISFSRWLTANYYLDLSESGSDLVLSTNVGGTNSFFIDTAGTFLELIANPGPSNDYLMFSIEETQGAATQVNYYEEGTGRNIFFSAGSARIGGGAESSCSNLTSDVDCDRTGTGSDLIVQDDIWAGGKIFATDWSDVSITESQISDLSHTTDTNRTDEEIEDLTGAMVSGNTETLIDVTYQDGDGTLDFIVTSTLSSFTNDAGFITTITNIFDQDLNKSDSVEFANVNITQNLTTSVIRSDINNVTIYGNLLQGLGSTTIGTFTNPWDAVYTDQLFTSRIDPENGADNTEFGGNIDLDPNKNVTATYFIGTGARFTDWSNVTITESQISDLSHTTDTNRSDADIIGVINNSGVTVNCDNINFSGTIGSSGICDGDDAAGAGSYDLNITSDSGIGTITDSEVLNVTGSGGITTSMSGNIVTIDGSGVTGTGDNLGNHVATTTLNLATNDIDNVGDIWLDRIFHNDDSDTYFVFTANNLIDIYAGNDRMITLNGDANEIAFNNASADIDFVVRSNTGTAFTVDGASGNATFNNNVSADYFFGDGSQLTNLPSSGGGLFENENNYIKNVTTSGINTTKVIVESNISFNEETSLVYQTGNSWFTFIGSIIPDWRIADGSVIVFDDAYTTQIYKQGPNVTITQNLQVPSGNVSANFFKGDGSLLTNLPSGSGDGTGGWTNTSTETNTSLIVNVNGDFFAYQSSSFYGDILAQASNVDFGTGLSPFTQGYVNQIFTQVINTVGGAGNINVTNDLYPSTNRSFDLGSAGYQWRHVYAENVTADYFIGDGSLLTNLPSSTDTNASTACADGEYLDGSGACINLNATIDARDTDTTYSNGTGLNLTGTEFSVNFNYLNTLYAQLNSAVTFTTVDTGQGAYELFAMNQDVETTDAVTFATVNTGQGANELYAMNQDVETTDAVTFATLDTGQGANELYDMDQNVLTSSDVVFNTVEASSTNVTGTAYVGGAPSYWNGTCYIVNGSTSTLEVC